MSHFHIVKKSDIDKTYKVARIMGDYDVQLEHSNEEFVGDIEYPENWKIGLIVGGSGTGKSTIANELFKDSIVSDLKYTHKSVIDDMPSNVTIEEIEKTFYSVGFGSVPSWLKPYNVLSNGEKMRVDLARMMLERDFIVFDEFTSVVDRQVAQTACLAINKSIKNSNKQFVAISCHKDIIEWLNPDWIFDTDTMQCFFMKAHTQENNLLSENVSEKNGRNLGNIII